MLKAIHVSEGLRMLTRRIKVFLFGLKHYAGTDQDICKAIVEDCWNKEKKYFMTSAGHFCEFWVRDFAWCIEVLMKQGHKERVMQTLEYAMHIFKSKKSITTTISPSRKAFDFPVYALDSVPLFIHSLRIAGAYNLIKKHQDFLQATINEFYELVIDKKSGLVKKDKHFSSMKDYAIQQSSCYGNCMASLLKDEIEIINKKKKIFSNPLKKFNYKTIIKKHFWTGSYFLDDLSGLRFPTGDANIIPFIYGPFKDKGMLKSCIKTIRKHKLDDPFPLKYAETGAKEHRMISIEFLAGGYERDSVWMHMGPLYIRLVQSIDEKLAQDYILSYKEIIEKYGNYLELFKKNKKPYQSLFYYADESMLWAANYLDLR